MTRRCMVCGCTEAHACEGGCAWRAGFARIGIPLCTRCVLELTLPLPPNLANTTWSHWGPKHRTRRAWIQRALALEPWLVGRRPVLPLARAQLQATVVLGQEMDQDNATARIKWAVDLLVDRGWLVDDAPAHLELLPVRQLIDRHEASRLVLALTDLPLVAEAAALPEAG